jgi:hypothetical protein
MSKKNKTNVDKINEKHPLPFDELEALEKKVNERFETAATTDFNGYNMPSESTNDLIVQELVEIKETLKEIKELALKHIRRK